MGMMAEDANEKLNRDRAALFALLDNWRGYLVKYAKQNAPWTDRTTTARRAIHGGVDRHKTHYVLYLAHGVKYGAFMETGTGIYGPRGKPIVPINAQFLHWVGPNGKDIFVKSVKGMEPRPIIVPTLDAHISKITHDVRELFGG